MIKNDIWQLMAYKIVQILWKEKGANIFHERVDEEALQINDYYEIVKKPMDFGTIKKKLTLNVYGRAEEFVQDLHQVFINCKLYNGVESYVGKCGVNIKKKFVGLLQNYEFNQKYFEKQIDFEKILEEEMKVEDKS